MKMPYLCVLLSYSNYLKKTNQAVFSKLIATAARELLLPSTRQFISSFIMSNYNVIFVLGGPGAGKGTQCEKIVQVRITVEL